MATENPMILVGSGREKKWLPNKDTSLATSPPNSLAAQELGLVLKGNRYPGNGKDDVPNRSGSAPPSMEGSFAAIGSLWHSQSSNTEVGWGASNDALQNYDSEEQLRSNPAYSDYYASNINLNPRLPPPLMSGDKRRLAHHLGGFRDNRRLMSFDDSSNVSLRNSRGVLPTHEEESEEDRSPVGNLVRQIPSDWTGSSSEFFSEQYVNSLGARHKSLVDLIQEDFPRTPSPVYNQSRSANEEGSPSLGAHAVGSAPSSEPSPSPDITVMTSQAGLQGDSTSEFTGLVSELSTGSAHFEDAPLVCSRADSDVTGMEAALKGLNLSETHKTENLKRHQERRQPQQSNLQQRRMHQQRTHAPISQGQATPLPPLSQGLHRQFSGFDQSFQGQTNFSSPNMAPTVEVQPVVQSGGVTPHLYAAASAYMASGNPLYHNLQPSIYAPQYGLGAYAFNAALIPPVMAGYPSHGAIPMAFDNSGSTTFNVPSASASTGGNGSPGSDIYKFNGPLGVALPSSFPDPHYMHYLQHPSEDAYSFGAQYDPNVGRGGGFGSQRDVFESQSQKSQFLRSGALGGAMSPRKGGFSSPSYYGSPPNMSLLMHYPTSPLASPVYPGSPMAVTSIPGRSNENFRFPLGTNRTAGSYSGWQGSRINEKLDDQKAFSFLEELKSSKARRELPEITGHIVEFSADQHGSRFIQQKLETCSPEEKESVFQEVLPHASSLMTDVFGNYVIQKFFEHGSSEQRRKLADQLVGQVLTLSLQMYGCRVIQKALEVVDLDQKTQLVQELDGHVIRCVRDQNGNHVIQKCIECVPTEKIEFIISAFRGQVVTLSTHPYGCRVIQRVLEHCTNEQQTQCIVDEILESVCVLAHDQYGNYVTQHVLEKGTPHERSQIISKLNGQVVQMSQHKFASNVIEKCLEYSDPAERDHLIDEIVGHTEGNDNLLIMMKDQFANYVVQKILETCNDQQREILLDRIRVHLNALKKYTYGKHIVARVEKLLYVGESHGLEA
ncbi:pumilio homolog 5 [Amborella trichopoda]|uniref:PUM-HD domain-containing protein n=1 Tax=Amborella trichopoda TaxID=13333 RepID=W1PYD1_AMBTC|nr:pumilio homolog 5 [Amborella trichopoda]ERN12505.1 hypothetical protein AMTR_s00025p00181800 [Amborella trichopoda]|eukprot:XP_006850924.1 pumilio homolog 5 [Amborella trichopoda]